MDIQSIIEPCLFRSSDGRYWRSFLTIPTESTSVSTDAINLVRIKPTASPLPPSRTISMPCSPMPTAVKAIIFPAKRGGTLRLYRSLDTETLDELKRRQEDAAAKGERFFGSENMLGAPDISKIGLLSSGREVSNTSLETKSGVGKNHLPSAEPPNAQIRPAPYRFHVRRNHAFAHYRPHQLGCVRPQQNR